MWQLLIGIFVALAVNEFSDLSPWLAQRIARTAASWHYRGSDRAKARAEEWSAVLDSAPGKLTKLFVAGTFLAAATTAAARRRWSVLHRIITTGTRAKAGRVLHQIYLVHRRRFLRGLSSKDRARLLLRERIAERAMAELLSQLQYLRHQTAMGAINNLDRCDDNDASNAVSEPVLPDFALDPQISSRAVVGEIDYSWRFARWRYRVFYPLVWGLSLVLDGKRWEEPR